MRVLKVNGNRVDLSKNTAIGITIQASDISSPDRKRFSVSNSFTLPFTNNNKKAFGFAESPFANTSIPYDILTVNYWDSNIHLIKDGKAYVKITTKGYKITVLAAGDVIDLMKQKSLRDLLRDNFAPLPTTHTGLATLLDDIINNNASGFCFNLWAYQSNDYASGSQLLDGNLGIQASKVFEYIESEFGYSIINSGTVTDDSLFNKASIPFYEVIPYGISNSSYNLHLYDDPIVTAVYESPNYSDDFEFYGKTTVLDFIKTIAIMFNCIIDINQDSKSINLWKFNDIASTTSINDWTGKVISKTKKFNIGSYAQQNVIDYLHDEGVSEDLGRVSFDCNNANLTALKTIKTKAFLPRSVTLTESGTPDQVNDIWLIGSTDDSDTTFTAKPLSNLVVLFEYQSTLNNHFVNCAYNDSGTANTVTASKKPMVLSGFDFSSEYSELETMLTNPVSYDAVMNIKQLDLHTFKVNELYKIDELGGTFYVNKIKGYNSKSLKGTKVELYKIK